MNLTAPQKMTLCCLAAVLFAGSMPGQTPPPAPAATTASPAATPASIPLTAIAEQSQAAINRVAAMTEDGSAEQSVAATRQGMADLTAQVSQWLVESNRAVNQRSSLDAYRDVQTGGRKLEEDLNGRLTILNNYGKTLDTESSQLDQDKTLWTETSKVPKDANVPAETLALCKNVLTAIKDASRRIKERRESILELQSQLSGLAGKVHTGLETVRQANAAAVATLFVRDAPPLWALPTQRGSTSPAGIAGEPFSRQVDAALLYSRQHQDLLALHAALALALFGLLLWLRRGLAKWTEEEPHLKRAAPIFEVPLATAVALSFLLKGTIYADAPVVFKAAAGAVWIVPMVILLRRLLDARLHPALYFLLLFYFVGQVLTALTSFPVTARWLFSGELLAAILVFGWVTTTSAVRSENDIGAVLGRWPRHLCRLAILLLAAALAAEVLGYSQLGTALGAAVLHSSYAAVFLYAMLRVIAGLLLIALRVRPLNASHIARNHNFKAHQAIYHLLGALAFGTWVWLTLDAFKLRELVFDRVLTAFNHPVSAGTLTISLGQLFGFGLAIWLSLKVAQLTRFFLEEEVFERVHLSPGLPYAISTMLNYLVLFVGFLIALGLLGVPLGRITILAGAFSVGLGFGLQNIINNFVSGIILLFERPVKVGDIIQIGDAVGEVRRIGIRASIIGTSEGSSIIVPNGNLISNQFTNWTYADRRRAVDVPLTIANGPDPNHVLDVLKTAAAEHNASKDLPAPEAYITALTATNIGLVVRASADRYEDWVQARSELYVALVAALTRENIRLG